MDKDKIRVIKISKAALIEFIYEQFAAGQDRYMDVESTEVSDYFHIDCEDGSFIFCAMNSDDENGNILTMPSGIDLKKLIKTIPDTTGSVFIPDRKLYREYTKDELIKLSNE